MTQGGLWLTASEEVTLGPTSFEGQILLVATSPRPACPGGCRKGWRGWKNPSFFQSPLPTDLAAALTPPLWEPFWPRHRAKSRPYACPAETVSY